MNELLDFSAVDGAVIVVVVGLPDIVDPLFDYFFVGAHSKLNHLMGILFFLVTNLSQSQTKVSLDVNAIFPEESSQPSQSKPNKAEADQAQRANPDDEVQGGGSIDRAFRAIEVLELGKAFIHAFFAVFDAIPLAFTFSGRNFLLNFY